MASVRFEKRGHYVSPPKKGRGRGGWAPFTVKWGPRANRPTGK